MTVIIRVLSVLLSFALSVGCKGHLTEPVDLAKMVDDKCFTGGTFDSISAHKMFLQLGREKFTTHLPDGRVAHIGAATLPLLGMDGRVTLDDSRNLYDWLIQNNEAVGFDVRNYFEKP